MRLLPAAPCSADSESVRWLLPVLMCDCQHAGAPAAVILPQGADQVGLEPPEAGRQRMSLLRLPERVPLPQRLCGT